VNFVELKDNQLPDGVKRATARQAEAEREKRAKFIAAEGESMAAAALGVRWTRWWPAAGPCDCGTCRRWPSSGGEEHHCDVPVTDDECDRPDQQLPHPGNHRRARDHTAAGKSQTIGTTGGEAATNGEPANGAGCGTGARGHPTARRMDRD